MPFDLDKEDIKITMGKDGQGWFTFYCNVKVTLTRTSFIVNKQLTTVKTYKFALRPSSQYLLFLEFPIKCSWAFTGFLYFFGGAFLNISAPVGNNSFTSPGKWGLAPIPPPCVRP